MESHRTTTCAVKWVYVKVVPHTIVRAKRRWSLGRYWRERQKAGGRDGRHGRAPSSDAAFGSCKMVGECIDHSPLSTERTASA